MLSQTFKINTMEDYLAYFSHKSMSQYFPLVCRIVVKRILEICRELEEEIDGINKENFSCWATINSLESQISGILLELSRSDSQESERLSLRKKKSSLEAKRIVGAISKKNVDASLDETPHSLHFY